MSRQNHTTAEVTTGGPTAELQRLKASGGESLAELREFTGQMRGRSPQEVLGIVSGSSLVRSTVMASVGLAVALIVLTIVPWMLQTPESSTAQAAAGTADTSSQPPATEEKTATETAAATEQTADSQPADDNPLASQAQAEKAVDAMGIGEVREAKSGDNPLDDKRIDSLLDID